MRVVRGNPHQTCFIFARKGVFIMWRQSVGRCIFWPNLWTYASSCPIKEHTRVTPSVTMEHQSLLIAVYTWICRPGRYIFNSGQQPSKPSFIKFDFAHVALTIIIIFLVLFFFWVSNLTCLGTNVHFQAIYIKKTPKYLTKILGTPAQKNGTNASNKAQVKTTIFATSKTTMWLEHLQGMRLP